MVAYQDLRRATKAFKAPPSKRGEQRERGDGEKWTEWKATRRSPRRDYQLHYACKRKA